MFTHIKYKMQTASPEMSDEPAKTVEVSFLLDFFFYYSFFTFVISLILLGVEGEKIMVNNALLRQSLFLPV